MSFADRLDLASPADDLDHSQGPPSARVTVVEYADFECLHCARVHPILKELRSDIPDAFRLVFRHFPLLHDHPRAAGAAKAAVAAARQGKFWPMHDRLLEYQAYLSPDAFQLHAEDLGLDLDRFNRDLLDPDVAARVERDMATGRASGVHGTPTFFLNGERIADPSDLRLLRRSILAASARPVDGARVHLPSTGINQPAARRDIRAL
jgi:protein-disulfide isomerase